MRAGRGEFAAYTGDSFRDLTRIARINDKMWAELFLWNRDNLAEEIDGFAARLEQLKSFCRWATGPGWRPCSAPPRLPARPSM